jgi:hypothetical protein
MLAALLWGEDNDYHVPPVSLTWHRRNRPYSSGQGGLERITINAGSQRTDAKLVLLHEIAHALAGQRGHQWHTELFWETAWELYRWAKLPIRYCQKREYSYRKKAAIAYRRSVKSPQAR